MPPREKNQNEKTNRIEVIYNPYTYELDILNSSLELKEESKIKSVIKKNRDKAIHLWYGEFFETLLEDFNSKSIEIIFNGREAEAIDFKEQVECFNKKGWSLSIKINLKQENKNIIESLEEYINDISTNAPEELKKELKEKKAIEEFESTKNNEAEVSVIATMSSGKSTLLNAILGKELLPAKNEACTATICRITDNKNLEEYKMRAETLDGKKILSWQKANSEEISKLNEEGNNEGINIYLEGNISGVTSNEMKLVLIDTPGPNNSQNIEHKEATYKFIKDTKNNPLVLYVMNATQHGTNDDARLLREISEIIKTNGKQSEERFIFALNKIDCFDPEKESIETLIENSKNYLKEFGIENPKIFPISAEAAKLIRLRKNGEVLSRTQQGNLNKYEYNFLPEGDYPGIDTIKYASIPENIKEKLYGEAKNNKEKAILNYSGITAIEIYIDKYVNKYAKTQKIKDSIGTLKKVVDSSYKEIIILKDKTEDEIEEVIKNIVDIKEILEIKGKKQLEEVRENIKKLNVDKEKYSNLFKRIEEKFITIENRFSEKQIKRSEAEKIIEDSKDEIENLVLSLKTESKRISDEELKEKVDLMINDIKKYFYEILGSVELGGEIKNVIESKFELELPKTYELLKYGLYTKQEKIGEEFSHTRSAATWYKPWTWFDREDVYRDVYGEVEYINLKNIYGKHIDVIKVDLRESIDTSQKEMLDNIESLKLEALKSLEKVESNIEKRINELKNKLEKQKILSNQKEEFENRKEKIIEYKIKLDKILKGDIHYEL